jgi:hypothetical protein
MSILGMTGCERFKCPERLQIIEFKTETTEKKLRVERDGRVSAGEDESVACDPVRVLRVMSHHLLKERVGDGCQCHGSSWMSVPDLLDCIHGESATVDDCAIVDR